jgi:hypothetical protein
VKTVALTLSRDQDPDVRAAAAIALAQFRGRDDSALDLRIRRDLIGLLESEGTVVPSGALLGLQEVTRAGGKLDGTLLEVVGKLAQHNMSHRYGDVRKLCSGRLSGP